MSTKSDFEPGLYLGVRDRHIEFYGRTLWESWEDSEGEEWREWQGDTLERGDICPECVEFLILPEEYLT